MPNNKFFICQTDDAKDLPLPKYMSKYAAGLDLYANVQQTQIIPAGKIKLIPTGIKISMPEDFEAQIRPRSGLALKHGITLLNTPGTIDSDYRGEIKLIMINLGEKDFEISRGDRIAQMIINKIEHVQFELVETLEDSQRSSGGFGSTGVK